MRGLGAGLVGPDPPQQVGAGRRSPCATRRSRRIRGRRAATSRAPGGPSSSSASLVSDGCTGRPWRAKIACVPHSANATNRACGNAACSPLFTPGRPKNSAFPVCRPHPGSPVDRDQTPPRQPHPGVSADPNGAATRANSAPAAPTPAEHGPGRSPTSTAAVRLRPSRGPRQPVGQQRQHILIRALGVQRHPDREVRHRPRRQRPMTLLGPTRTRRSPHRPDPAGTPASTHPPTPDPTTDDPTPASSTQHAAHPQTTPL